MSKNKIIMSSVLLLMGFCSLAFQLLILDARRSSSEILSLDLGQKSEGLLPESSVAKSFSEMPESSIKHPMRWPSMRLITRFDEAFARFEQGDTTVDLQVLDELVMELRAAIEFDPDARALLLQKIREALRAGDFNLMQRLELIFLGSHVGALEMRTVFWEEVDRKRDNDWYAIQGLGKLWTHMPDSEKLRLLKSAVDQLSAIEINRARPAIDILSTHAVNLNLDGAAEIKDRAAQLLALRQSRAQGQIERTITTNALFRLLPLAQRLELAKRELSGEPSSNSIQIILEACLRGDLPEDPALLSMIAYTVSRLKLDVENEALARMVLEWRYVVRAEKNTDGL